jgi:branched-chain amino acid transport system permease protein
LPGFWVVTLITAGINASITMGLYFSNAAGALSAAHAAIAGMGAYLGAVLTTNCDWPFPLALLAGAILGFATGMLLALLTLRMNELVAGLTTLAFGETMVIIAFNIDYIGGANGFIGIPLETTFDLVYLVLAIVVFAAWRFDRSRLGYAARACRDNAGAAAMGINITWVKTLVFALGSAIAGVGGALRAHYVLVQNPDDMGFFFFRQLLDLLGLWRLVHLVGARLWCHVPDDLTRAAAFLGVRSVHHLWSDPHGHGHPATPGGHHQGIIGAPAGLLRAVSCPCLGAPHGSWREHQSRQPGRLGLGGDACPVTVELT